MEPLEAAFSMGETDDQWHARVTWKCPICGRRNSKLEKGPGKMQLPLKVQCKHGHETDVVPYRWSKDAEIVMSDQRNEHASEKL